MPTVYIDQFIVINVIINYILLFVTKKILNSKSSNPRLFIGSIIGVVYAMFIFMPNTHYLFSIAGKLVFSLVLVAVTYKVKKLKTFLRAIGTFYLVCFVFGGSAFAVMNFVNSDLNMSFTIKILITSTVIAYFVISCISSYCKKYAVKCSSFTDLEISLKGNTVTIKSLIDTGNSLCDPLSNTPVIIAEFDKVKNLFPNEMIDTFVNCHNFENAISVFSKYGITNKFRLIPYNSVGKQDGFIIGFKPDSVKINNTETKAIIGISQNNISSDDTYYALINPQVFA